MVTSTHHELRDIVHRELDALLEDELVRDARVRIHRVARCFRCRISAHTPAGNPVSVVAVGETRTRAVETAVRRLRDVTGKHRAGPATFVGPLPRRHAWHGFRGAGGRWSVVP